MSLKGKSRILRNIIAGLIVVIFMVGITSVVYSFNDRGITIWFNGKSWNGIDEPPNDWVVGSGNIELELDFNNYYDSSLVSAEDPFTIQAYLNDENDQNNEIPNTNIIVEKVEPSNFTGKFKVTIKVPEDKDDIDASIKFILSIKNPNAWGIAIGQPPRNFTIKMDVTEPKITIQGVENNKVYKDTDTEIKNIGITSSEAVTGANIIVYKFTEDKYEEINFINGINLSTTYAYSVKLPESENKVEEGNYKIEIKGGKDSAGKEFAGKVIEFRVNSKGPKIIVSGSDKNNKVYNKVKLEITDMNTIKEYTYKIDDGNENTINIDSSNYNTKVEKELPIPKGTHLLVITSKDIDGKESEKWEDEITVDTDSPTVNIYPDSVSGYITEEKSQKVDIKITDDNIPSVSHEIEVLYRDGQNIDGQNIDVNWYESTENNTKTFSYIFSSNDKLKDGKYEIKASAKDAAGNEDENSKDTLTFSIDGNKPDIFIKNAEGNDLSLGEADNDGYKTIRLDKEEKLTISVEDRFLNCDVSKTYINIKELKEIQGMIYEAVYIQDDEKINESDQIGVIKEFKEGVYKIIIKAEDEAGHTNQENIKLIVDKGAPTVDVTINEDKKESSGFLDGYEKGKVKITASDSNIDYSNLTLNVEKDDNDMNQELSPEDKLEFKLQSDGSYVFEHDFRSEGAYHIYGVVRDLAGKETPLDIKFIIDTTAPVIKIDNFNDLNNQFFNSQKSVTIKIDEENFDKSTVKVDINKKFGDNETIDKSKFNHRGGITHECTIPFSDDNEYTITISATDIAGNKHGENPEVMVLTIDTIKPKVEIDGVDDGEHYNTDKTVTISSTDANHNINTVTVTKDGKNYPVGEFTVNGRDALISHPFSLEGEYEITLYSEDKAGNDSTTSKKFTIDKTAPVITPMFMGESRVIKDKEYINKIFTPQFKLDEAEDKITKITLNGSDVTTAVPMASTEMVYHYEVEAVDEAGNRADKLDITFTVDVTNPEIKVTGILNGFFNEDITPKYRMTDKNLDKENTLATLNGSNFISGTKIEKQDYYNLKLSAMDLAENSTVNNIEFVIDKDKPVIKFLDAISGQYFTEKFIPNFIIEDLTDYTIISMTLDGKDYEEGDEITEEGKHVLYIEVKDKAENIESISIEFILDMTAPEFIIDGIKDNGVYVDPVSAQISLDNPLDTITEVIVNDDLANGSIEEKDGEQIIKLNFSEIGNYEVVVKAVDDAGNETEEVINFMIAKKNIFAIIYDDKIIFYPLMIVLGIIVAGAVITVVKKNKKEETQEEGSEE